MSFIRKTRYQSGWGLRETHRAYSALRWRPGQPAQSVVIAACWLGPVDMELVDSTQPSWRQV
jgi:hypothetical protein